MFVIFEMFVICVMFVIFVISNFCNFVMFVCSANSEQWPRGLSPTRHTSVLLCVHVGGMECAYMFSYIFIGAHLFRYGPRLMCVLTVSW